VPVRRRQLALGIEVAEFDARAVHVLDAVHWKQHVRPKRFARPFNRAAPLPSAASRVSRLLRTSTVSDVVPIASVPFSTST
jgi:hypothetical protein